MEMLRALRTGFQLTPILLLSMGCALACREADPRLWVPRLGSEDPEARDQAAVELLAMGDAALPALTVATRDPDPEISAQARALIERLEMLHWAYLYDGFETRPVRDAIYECNLDGTGKKKLAEGRFPSPSPDGNLLAFVRASLHRQAVILDLRSGEEQVVESIDPGDRPPVWSEDGKSLAWLADKQDAVFLLNPGTGRCTRADSRYTRIKDVLGWTSNGSGVWTLDTYDEPRFFTPKGLLLDRYSGEVPEKYPSTANGLGTWTFFSIHGDSHASGLWIRNETTGRERRVLENRLWGAFTAWACGGKRLVLSTGVDQNADDIGEVDLETGELRCITRWIPARSIVSAAVPGDLPFVLVVWTQHAPEGGVHFGPGGSAYRISLVSLDSGQEWSLGEPSTQPIRVVPIRRR